MIRAGPGFRPLLVWDRLPSSRANHFISGTNLNLTLENLDFVAKISDPGQDEHSELVRLEGGELDVENCTFAMAGRSRAGSSAVQLDPLRGEPSGRCRLVHCLVRAAEAVAVDVRAAGADVTLAVRNVDAGTNVAAAIAEKLPAGSSAPHVIRLDLADLSTVACVVQSWKGPLHILVNNAGVMALPQLTRTAAGHEMQFATNHLGHFALATGLRRWLATANGARVKIPCRQGGGRSLSFTECSARGGDQSQEFSDAITEPLPPTPG